MGSSPICHILHTTLWPYTARFEQDKCNITLYAQWSHQYFHGFVCEASMVSSPFHCISHTLKSPILSTDPSTIERNCLMVNAFFVVWYPLTSNILLRTISLTPGNLLRPSSVSDITRAQHFPLPDSLMQVKLEQLERLHSEIPPVVPWLPILVIHIRSQVKTRQSQKYKFKKTAKFFNFARNFTRNTPSEVAWQDI